MFRCIFSVNEKILFHRLALGISFTRQCKPKSECESEFRKLPLISSPSYKPQVQLQAHLPVNKTPGYKRPQDISPPLACMEVKSILYDSL